MTEAPTRRPVVFIGRALEEIRSFPLEARHDAGHHIDLVQQGTSPPGAKAMPGIGSGVWEIRIAASDSWFRVFYLANLGGKVYILHGFQKKSNQTPRTAVETGKRRYRIAIEESSASV